MIVDVILFLIQRTCVSAQIVIMHACDYLSDEGLDDMISYLQAFKVSREVKKDLESRKVE